ncbi:MAG: hypothetical protein U0Z75_05600 [Deinococcaceae bacterium]
MNIAVNLSFLNREWTALTDPKVMWEKTCTDDMPNTKVPKLHGLFGSGRHESGPNLADKTPKANGAENAVVCRS